MIAHIVLFTPKSDIEKTTRLAFAQSVIRTVQAIPDVEHVSVGKRVHIDAGYERSFGDKTYEMAAVMHFQDRNALVRYLQHPLHADLGRLFWEVCGSTVISEVELVDLTSDGAAEELAK